MGKLDSRRPDLIPFDTEQVYREVREQAEHVWKELD